MGTKEIHHFNDPNLSDPEVCRFLKINRRTLYRMDVRGDGPPFFRIGKLKRRAMSAILAWRASRTENAVK